MRLTAILVGLDLRPKAMRLAGQDPAGRFLVGAERLRLMDAVDHAPFEQAALARAARAVLAAVGQTDSLADRGTEDRLVAIDLEVAPAGLHGDVRICRPRQHARLQDDVVRTP